MSVSTHVVDLPTCVALQCFPYCSTHILCPLFPFTLHVYIQLLRDLDYTDAVTVHVVYNGQEMPDYKEWNAAQFLD